MYGIFCISLLLLLASTPSAFSATISFEELLNLNEATFFQHIHQEATFVMFYAPWCGHSKKLMPTWAELSQRYKPDELKIAKVDCTAETKLCSEENIRGYPTLLLYDPYGGESPQNGVRFHGERTLAAFSKFVEDTSNIDSITKQFELEGFVYVMTADNFLEIFKQPNAFVMFYVPWCSHCTVLKPTWEALAKKYNLETKTVIAKMDCSVHKSTCAELGIKAYPSLVYFNKGTVTSRYEGTRELKDLQTFVDLQYSLNLENDADEADEKIPSEDDEDTESVLSITGAKFHDTIGSTDTITFVKFYTPWCGHCKRLAPVWELLGKHYKRNSGVVIAKLDCEEYSHICKAQKVEGYPTLNLYHRGKFKAQHEGGRSLPDLIQFVTKHQPKEEL
ncbi:thioredoxin domain-containing protein 5-like [Watersipora subatra]|uniref:thioredoxin domain-containing protein 5-like n=1 Tax=Watersipora subatra TaxID=2589382 RepID=UPI00355B844B